MNKTQRRPILELRMSLNVKNLKKAIKIVNRIQIAVGEELLIEEIYKSGLDEFTVYSYINTEYEKPSEAITWALTTLDKIGEKWYIEAPKLMHKEYWKFRGTRLNQWSTFKINGIKEVDFELTNYNRELMGINIDMLDGEKFKIYETEYHSLK